MNRSKWHEANREKVRTYAREYGRKYRAENREKIRKDQRAWYAKNKHRACMDSKMRYERVRDTVLRFKYGIGLVEYHAMLTEQNGVCAICKTSTPGGRGVYFHIDHCHTTGKVRGLLCSFCNRMLGYARDNVATLITASEYLVKNR